MRRVKSASGNPLAAACVRMEYRIAELEAENKRLKKYTVGMGLCGYAAICAERDDLQAELAHSREQTEYANDAMMAMCKRAEQAEDELEKA